MESESGSRIIFDYEEKVNSNAGEEHGKTYRGQWKHSQGKLVRDGLGTMTWPDGSVYKG
jgi:hypothetical protein